MLVGVYIKYKVDANPNKGNDGRIKMSDPATSIITPHTANERSLFIVALCWELLYCNRNWQIIAF